MNKIDLKKYILPNIEILKSNNFKGEEIYDFRNSKKFDLSNKLVKSINMPSIDYFLKLIHQERKFSKKCSVLNNIKTNKNSTKLFRKNIYGEEMIYHVEKILRGKNKIVLDLCSGNGENESIFYKLGAKEVILTDYRSENVHLLTDVHNLPFKKNTFDLVFCSQAMEHWYDPYEAIRQVNLILKPGGVFICSVSFLERWHGNSFFHCSPHAIFSLCLNNNLKLIDFWLGNEPLNDLIRSKTIFKSKKINNFFLKSSDLIYKLLNKNYSLIKNQIISSKSFSFVAVKENVNLDFSSDELYNRSMN